MAARGKDARRNVMEAAVSGVPAGVPFVICATATLALAGFLFAGGGIDGFRLKDGSFTDELPGWGVALIGVWMAGAAVVGLVLPLAALAIWGRHTSIRRALAPYVLVLVFQICLEILFARLFLPNIVVLTGILFTGYRLWQLRSAWRSLRESVAPGRCVVRWILLLGLGGWTANLLFLALISLPRVLEFG